LRAWKARLEDERHRLKRKIRLKARGKEDPETAKTLKEIDLNIEIAYVELKLEDLSAGPNDGSAQKRREDLEEDHKLASLKLDLFHKENEYEASPTEELKKQIEEVNREIERLEKASE